MDSPPSQFLLFQVAPVQDFIAQARSTRDLWSGSYLISWLVAHALLEVRRQNREEATAHGDAHCGVVFPECRDQPLIKWLEKYPLEKWLQMAPHARPQAGQEELTPNLPNRFFAETSGQFDPVKIVKAFNDEWQSIADACWSWLDDTQGPELKRELGDNKQAKDRWDFQVKNHWQIAWQLWPYLPWEKAGELWNLLPKGETKPKRTLTGDKDDDKAWVANYELICHRLDARRHLRNFEAWDLADRSRLHEKDAYSGKDDAIFSGEWLKKAKSSRELRVLFRSQEPLGAVNIIKRIWHRAYLARRGLALARAAFDSVPGVAANAWVQDLAKAVGKPEVAPLALSFRDAMIEASDCVPIEVRNCNDAEERIADEAWFTETEGSIYFENYWRKWRRDELLPRAKDLLEAARTKLAKLTEAANLGSAPRYYAVLAMDGDDMGKWIGGEKTGQASRTFHQDFSAALSNFGIKKARSIVEEIHHGRLIYSGGDDVLAMVPARSAIGCADDLQKAFAEAVKKAILNPVATASVGIAIGHINEPLQDMVEAAGLAERRAKNVPEKSALAVTVFKRSGEMLEWVAQFGSPAFDLLRVFGEYYRPRPSEPDWKPPISGRFPHRLAELLQPFETFESSGGLRDFSKPEPLKEAFIPVVLAEFDHVVSRQTSGLSGVKTETLNGESDVGKDIRKDAEDYLKILAKTKRPLRDFYQLFLLEAFLERQGDF